MSDDTPETRVAGLLLRFRPMVRSVIARVGGRILREQAEDVEQEVRLALWRRLRREQDVEHPTSYVYTVARREAVRAVKRELSRRREAETPVELPQVVAQDPHRQAVARQEGERIREALARLAPDRRRAVQAHLSGLDVDEIMDLFGWPYEKARNLIARGKADLRELLREEP